MRASRIILSPAWAYTRRPSTFHSRLTQRTTSPSTPASATSRLVPAPSVSQGTPRSMHDSTSSAGSCVSMTNSSGLPMLKEVCRASGWSRSTPRRPESHSRLAFVRQLIAQLPNVAGAHQEHQVPLAGQLLELLPCAAQVRREPGPRHSHGKVDGTQLARVLLAGGVDLGHDHRVGTLEALRELVAQGLEA